MCRPGPFPLWKCTHPGSARHTVPRSSSPARSSIPNCCRTFVKLARTHNEITAGSVLPPPPEGHAHQKTLKFGGLLRRHARNRGLKLPCRTGNPIERTTSRWSGAEGRWFRVQQAFGERERLRRFYVLHLGRMMLMKQGVTHPRSLPASRLEPQKNMPYTWQNRVHVDTRPPKTHTFFLRGQQYNTRAREGCWAAKRKEAQHHRPNKQPSRRPRPHRSPRGPPKCTRICSLQLHLATTSFPDRPLKASSIKSPPGYDNVGARSSADRNLVWAGVSDGPVTCAGGSNEQERD